MTCDDNPGRLWPGSGILIANMPDPRWIVDVRFRVDAPSADEAEACVARSLACREAAMASVEFVETQRNDQPRPSWKVDGE